MPSEAERLAAGLAGRYRVERELGSGGMATVYLAEDLKHRRRVAIKVLRPELAASLGAERFLREIDIAASLTHPNILPLHDSGEADGMVYYVMPFVEGESLRDRLLRERQLPVADAIQIAREVAAGLSYAHSRGVIHRDIKPENVLLSSGTAVVADFGIARAVSAAGGSALTGTGLAIGTPGYMSPEQASGEASLDARTDVYALGCLLYEMLSGQTPHTGATAQAILARMLTDPVRPIRPIRDTVSDALDDVMRRALAKTPADRFETASRFADALAGARTAAPARRRWRIAAAAAALIGVASAGAWALRANITGPAPVRRVAVLPLDNIGRDSSQDYFVDGLTEAMIGTLAQIASLQVISRTSVMQYKEARKGLPDIARELRADAVVEGSVVRSEGRVRVRVRLVDARTDTQIWGQEFDRELRDILRLQSDIAVAIARQLDARLTRGQSSRLAAAARVVPEAHEAYLRGRRQLEPRTPEGFQEALVHFRRALALDSTYAPAYAGLADYYRLLPFYDTVAQAEAFAKSRVEADRALALDSSLASAHASLAYLHAFADWNWAEAEREYLRALALSPNDADTHHNYSRLLAALGRLPEAEAEAQRSHELDPLSLVAHANLGVIAYFSRNYSRAAELLRATLVLDSAFSVAHWGLGLVNEQLGRFDEAKAKIEDAIRVSGRGSNNLASLGHVLGMAGRTREAEAVLAELLARARASRRRTFSYQLALIYTGLRRPDDAFAWLERGLEERSPLLSYLAMDPRLDGLRGDARFTSLLRRIHMTPDSLRRRTS